MGTDPVNAYAEGAGRRFGAATNWNTLRAVDESPGNRRISARYELLTLLAGQAARAVWRARDTLTGNNVAVKLLSSASGLRGARAMREVSLLRRLRVPGVVALLDEGTENGQRYLVMDLIEGLPASRRAARCGPGRASRPPSRRCSRRCRTCTTPAWCTATSSPRTCSSTRAVGRRCSTSACRGRPPRIRSRAPATSWARPSTSPPSRCSTSASRPPPTSTPSG